jgi:DNA-binding HxlR family transcriptional regulator
MNVNLSQRSGCPINLTAEVLGDRWSLVILRDMMFGNRRHFRNLLTNSLEGIASNILSARLKHFVENGLISAAEDPSHKQKVIYSLTEAAIQLVPVFAALGEWGSRHLPVTEELSVRAQLLSVGGPELWDEFMEELRVQHLNKPPKKSKRAQPNGRSVLQRLDDAYHESHPAKRSGEQK